MMDTARRVRSEYLLPLSEVTRADVTRVGAKAANLGELLRAGYLVPEGIVLTTAAFDRFLEANDWGVGCAPDLAGSVLRDVVDAIGRISAAIGDGPLAVRSSAIAEDRPDASFAGQYDTVLDVRGCDALVAAVRRCWASAQSRRVEAYREARDHGDAARLAVLIQRLVPAEAAGVVFTANPTTGHRDEVIVSAVRGRGDHLVAGETDPDEWCVRDQEVECRRAPERALDAEQVRAIAALARRVEAHFGCPQDVEWALAGGELYLLQARPITALPRPEPEPIPMAVQVPPGFWQREVSHFPRPVSPAFRWWPDRAHNELARRVMVGVGLLVEGEHREIGGWSYVRFRPVGGKDGPPPPAWLVPLIMPIVARLVPELRSRIKPEWRRSAPINSAGSSTAGSASGVPG